MKFYICRRCGNIVTKLTSSKVPLHCCGQPMELLEAGVTPNARTKVGMTVLVDAIGPPPSVLDPLTAPEGSEEWEKKRGELRIGESEGKLEVIRALIAGGADVNLQSFYQNGRLVTPLGNAKEFRYRKIEMMLREAGARE